MSPIILIVEDEREIREDLSKILTLSDYETICTNNGNDGIILANNHNPDLIISDILLPGLSGYEFLRRLQENPETSSIPFLFLSAKSNKFDVREAMNLGADDFITKPYDIDELLSTIKIRLEKKIKRESHLSQKIENLQTNLRKTMPHEIRTPLNVILGFSEFLMKNNKNVRDVEALDMLSNIHESGQRLLRTFENYLLFANLELISASQSEKFKYQKYKTYMVDIFLNDIITSKAIEYDRLSDVQTNIESASVTIYEEHFRKIIEELIDNSFKFSQPGTIVKIESCLENNFYKIVFSDAGRGMTAKQLASLGDFVQLERTMYEQQGAGLGLSIVKRIIEIYNGNVSIESVQNQYTIITVKLPGSEDYTS
jgi:signal transduction histidine kinase